jgi:TRAP-type uncharacterized transport system substrate-binding protein
MRMTKSRRNGFTVLSAAAILLIASMQPGSGQDVRRLVFQGGTGGNNFEILWNWLTARLEQDPAWKATIDIVPSDGIAGLDALNAGRADFTLVKAPATVGLAYRGIGLFDRPYQTLRAFGLLPVVDWLTLIVRPGIQAADIGELLRQNQPLRVATGRDSPRDVVTFLFEQILRFHGSSVADLERRKGAVLRLEPGASLQAALDGKVDAVFQEAQSVPLWDQLFAKGWTAVSIDAPALAHLQREYGFGRTVMPAEFHRSTRTVQTVEFSNVLLCVRADTPEDVVAWVTRTMLDHKGEMEDIFRKRAGRRPWLAVPVDRAFFESPAVIPHHPGALRAFKQK